MSNGDASQLASVDVTEPLLSFWRSVPLADRLAAIEYFLAEVPHREDYAAIKDGVPARYVERLAKRLNMRPIFLQRDRVRAARMLEQYGHQSLGPRLTYFILRAFLRLRHSDEFQAVLDAASDVKAAQENEDDWSVQDTQSVLFDARRGLARPIDDALWSTMIRVATDDELWQTHAVELLESPAQEEAAEERTRLDQEPGISRVTPLAAVLESPAEVEAGSPMTPAEGCPTDATDVQSANTMRSRAPVETIPMDEPGRSTAAAASGAVVEDHVFPVDEEVEDEPEFREPTHRLTGLDRAMVDFILNTAIGTPGAQSSEDVLTACDEWSRLSTHRFHSYYCLGLAHGLLDSSIDGFERQEMNEARNAWYAAGRIAALQRRHDREGLNRFLATNAKPLSALVGRSVVRPQEATRGAARQLLRQAMDFLADCDRWTEIANITRCAGPYIDRSLLEALYRHISELVATRRPTDAEAVLTEVLSDSVPCPGELRARMRRRWAQVAAMQNKLAVAEGTFEALTACGYADVEARALVDLSLLKAGLASAAQMRLPEGNGERRDLLKKYDAVADSVSLALTGIAPDGGTVARADGLAFLAVVAYLRWCGYGEPGRKPSVEATLQAVEDALRAIQSAKVEHQYQLGGTLGLLLMLEAVLRFERGDAVRGMAAWRSVPHETGRLPLEDLHTLVLTAAIVETAAAEAIVDSILRHRPVSEVRKPDPVWLAASGNLRRSHAESIETLILTCAEKLELYDRLLEAARKAEDREIALKCLDSIYRLGVFEGQAEAALERFLRSASWEGLWSRAEASEAIADLCVRRKRKDEAVLYLEDSFEAAMLVGDLDYASALLARMQEIGLPDAEYNVRAARLPAASSATATLSDLIARHVARPIRVVFIGGDERQAQYDDELRAMLRAEFEDLVQVEFIHPGWSSNWGRSVDEVLRQCESRDAVVLMKFIRTLMGRTLRERLTKPWVSCSGHGRKSIHLAILQAVQVVVRQKARGARPA